MYNGIGGYIGCSIIQTSLSYEHGTVKPNARMD
mgnify:FL=1